MPTFEINALEKRVNFFSRDIKVSYKLSYKKFHIGNCVIKVNVTANTRPGSCSDFLYNSRV